MLLIKILKSDLYRYSGQLTYYSFIKCYFLIPGFNYLVWFRIASRYNNILTKFILFRKMLRFGIEIYATTKIDKGFYIGHWGGIIVNPQVKIGINCNISQGVTIGKINSGKREGVPSIGNYVYFAPGSKVLGNIKIGNNVIIAPNSVVIDDVPNNVTVAGIPAKIISNKSSKDYINKVLV